MLTALARNQPLKIEGARYNDPHTKANVILQCHFSRRDVGREMEADQVTHTLNPNPLTPHHQPSP